MNMIGRLKRWYQWGSVLAETDVRDPKRNEPLYAYIKVRPWWYWAGKRAMLFLSLVWRRWEATDPNSRIGFRTAWQVARLVYENVP